MRFSEFWMIGLAVLLSACGGSKASLGVKADSASPVEVSDLTGYALRQADSLLSGMSLEQKAAQIFIPAMYARADAEAFSLLEDYAEAGVGGVLLLKGDSESASVIADTIRNMSAISPFVAIDAEWGLAMRLTDAPRFPVNSGIGGEVSDTLMYDYGREMARECRRLGINVVLGPVLDISDGGFISKRSLGSDPERVSRLSLAYARGLVSGNVMSVAKHFPGHGSASGDSHKHKVMIERSLHSLDSLDLRPFREYVDQGLPAVMVGHLAFPAIDPEMLPAAVSKAVITDLLREDMGFNGLVFTDALNMAGSEGYGADMAVAAGADIVLAPVNTREGIRQVVDAVNEGRIKVADLDSHVRRILLYKFLMNFGNESEEESPLDSEEARRISRMLRQEY